MITGQLHATPAKVLGCEHMVFFFVFFQILFVIKNRNYHNILQFGYNYTEF